MKNVINWRMFFILLSLCLISIICVFPYVVTLQGELLQQIGQPLSIIFIAQLVQSLILFAIAIFFGLFFTKKINFKLPLIEAILEKRDYKNIFKDILKKSIPIGAIVAIAIYLLDIIFTMLGTTLSTHQNYAPVWQKLLAAIYGGTAEEILMRLFLMTFFIWIGMKLFKRQQPSTFGIVISIFLAAIIFGLGHLPITASLVQINSLVVLRAIILNGVGGIVFGWLFWKKGLESAMIAHFATDVVLLTLLPMLFR